MMWDDDAPDHEDSHQDSPLNFDFFSFLSNPKDYYRILEVDYDASEDTIRTNYIRLALKWHPDKQKDQGSATSRFQEINEAYQGNKNWNASGQFVHVDYRPGNKNLNASVLSDPVKRREYDRKGMLHVYDYNIIEYLNRHKGLILTCNGLGIRHSIW